MQFDPGLEYQPNRGERDDNSWLMYCWTFANGPYSFLWKSSSKSERRSHNFLCNFSAFAFASEHTASFMGSGQLSLNYFFPATAGRVTPSGGHTHQATASDIVTVFITSKHLHILLGHGIYNIFHPRWCWTFSNTTDCLRRRPHVLYCDIKLFNPYFTRQFASNVHSIENVAAKYFYVVFHIKEIKDFFLRQLGLAWLTHLPFPRVSKIRNVKLYLYIKLCVLCMTNYEWSASLII